MRPLPRKVTILTQAVPITRVPKLKFEGSECYGVFHPDGPSIEITTERTIGHGRIRHTLTHEILHAILTINGLASMFDDQATEEKFVDRMSPAILAFLRENESVVAYLQERV